MDAPAPSGSPATPLHSLPKPSIAVHAGNGPPTGAKGDKAEQPPQLPPKTESLENMLSTLPCLKQKTYLHHLHILIYLPYKRWMSTLPEECFTAECFPEYEGWRNAWIKPVDLGTGTGALVRKVEQFSEPVCLVDIVFHDSFSSRGFITKSGELIGTRGPDMPKNGIITDHEWTISCFDIFDVSRLFTMVEITSGIRGSIYRSNLRRIRPRLVWNIISSSSTTVGDEEEDIFTMRKIPDHDYDQVEYVKCSRNELQDHAPETVAEWIHRKKAGTLSKADVKAIAPYFEKLFKRAMDDDKSAREAYNDGFPARNEGNWAELLRILLNEDKPRVQG